jgi:hypothetical protein
MKKTNENIDPKVLQFVSYEIALGEYMVKIGDWVEFLDSRETRKEIILDLCLFPKKMDFWNFRDNITSGVITHIEVDTYYKGLSIIIQQKKGGQVYSFPYAVIKSINGKEINYEQIFKNRG